MRNGDDIHARATARVAECMVMDRMKSTNGLSQTVFGLRSCVNEA